ncbi:hypothetical protein AMTR_s00063p00188450 [Amborella trichopoda]|uniref:Aminotransferase-like plant mobile domain-containing protein n=1 Tax=Amborella trichopoda TaxID=13333 RepID=U5D1H9_AMBTC|nr:hypothetical protein AMTR_s00063p00188450 [Amborella trichopoda]
MFQRLPHNYNRTTLLRYTRTYLLYLVGYTIFANSTDGTVPTIYLQRFEDVDVASQYAWSAVALAFLFRALSKVIRSDYQHLSGSTTLLLVIWTPHDDYPDIGQEPAKDRDYGLLVRQTALYRTYLICRHICEGYMPDRVLRQFGLHQGIPVSPLQWARRERRGKMTDNWKMSLELK